MTGAGTIGPAIVASAGAGRRGGMLSCAAMTLRIISANLNGIRSAASKGFHDWLAESGADVVCLQELKAQLPDLTDALRAPGAMRGWFHCAEKKGYSGVGIYARRQPDRVVEGIGNAEFDAEGRYIRADWGDLSVVSVYLPSGSSSPERQEAKFRFMYEFFPHLAALRGEGREIVLCGDWNIAHKEIDLKNWKSNQKNSGFLPEERAWLTRVFDELGWVDVYRRLYPEAGGEAYTWWSNRGQAWAKNVGWRIDYHIATPGIAAKAVSAAVYKERRFSDHAPLTVDYDLNL
jgi:exodeoxyribonuclease-3